LHADTSNVMVFVIVLEGQ